MTDADKRLVHARRPHQNLMPFLRADMSEVLGPRRQTRLALVIPVFSWETRQLEEHVYGHAQVDGFRRAFPWHVLSLIQNSDFAESDFTVHVAFSDVVAEAMDEPLARCNFPENRVIRFPQEQHRWAWTHKITVLTHPELAHYDGVIHSDCSNFVCRGPNGERLEVFQYIAENWNTDEQDFCILDNYPPPEHAWSTFYGAIKIMARMGLRDDLIWRQISEGCGIAADKLYADWRRKWNDHDFIDVRGPFYGVAKGLRTDERWRAYIMRLMDIIPFEDGALSLYCYEQGFGADDVFSVGPRMMLPNVEETNILAGAPHTAADYLYGYSQQQDDEQARIAKVWMRLWMDLKESLHEKN